MTTLTETVRRLTDMHNAQQEMAKELIASLSDKSIPLDDRWAAFEGVVKLRVLNDVESYGDGFIDHISSNITLYDDFYMERHEEKSYPDMLEQILDFEVPPTDETINAWKELVLASGKSGFCNDW